MILLVGINAKYIHSNLGIYCIMAYAGKHGISENDLQIAEYTINQNEYTVIEDIYERKPKMLAFSCYIWNIEHVVNISREVHKLLPDTDIWFGGPEVSFDALNQLKKYSWIRGIMSGEGEITFYELARYYTESELNTAVDNMEDFKRVDGIVYRGEKDKFFVNSERSNMSMDEVVFPYNDMEKFRNRIIYYETSRGCPYGCSYCLSSVEKNVRFRSMELVEKELEFFLKLNVTQVKFVDRTFNCNHEHTMSIWKYIYEHDNGITNFHFELSADLLTDEEIEYVSNFRPGLVQFEIGVQTANPDTLKAIHRNPDLTILKEKVAKVRKGRNIHQHLDLIAGLPYEDYTSFRNSFNEVYEMKPDQLQLGFLKVLKGSPIYYDRDKYGIVYQDIPPYEVLYTKWISYDDILNLKHTEEMVEKYYNSMQFEASVRFMVQHFETPFDFFQKIGNYYHKQGYDVIQQSRIQNYVILLEFARMAGHDKFTEEDERVLIQMLIFDLYAREKLKKIPDFAYEFCGRTGENGEKQTVLRGFYQSEENIEKYLSDYKEYDWKQILRMTHIQRFNYDILYYIESGILSKETCVFLFDYKKRNPLNYQAEISKIEIAER